MSAQEAPKIPGPFPPLGPLGPPGGPDGGVGGVLGAPPRIPAHLFLIALIKISKGFINKRPITNLPTLAVSDPIVVTRRSIPILRRENTPFAPIKNAKVLITFPPISFNF